MPHGIRNASRGRTTIVVALLAAVMLAGCVGPFSSQSPATTPTPTPTPTPALSATPGPPTIGTSASPTATAEPPLSLALPITRDSRRLRVTIQPSVPASGTGRLTITVMNVSPTRISELILRWPTPLDRIVFLAPFLPSSSRLTDALVQPWTKWVIGPGEQGEPAGTTSLGWGPLDPGATLTIPLIATRRAAGPIAFDLQFLTGEALLTTEAGAPAETRVSIR
jgi:hypothetical protein